MYDGLSGRGGAGASRADFGWVGGSPLGKVVPAAGGRRARALAGAGRRRVTFLRCASLPNRSWGRAFRCVQLPKRAKVKRRTAHPPPPAGWSRAQALTHRARRRRARRRGRAPRERTSTSRDRGLRRTRRAAEIAWRAPLSRSLRLLLSLWQKPHRPRPRRGRRPRRDHSASLELATASTLYLLVLRPA